MNESSNETRKKALIVGLDGVSCSLLQEYIGNGVMPHLKRILERGFALVRMNASLPEVSSVSWTSFATGVNPGEHGVFGFTDLLPSSYTLYFSNSRWVKAPAFWELLGGTAGDKHSSLRALSGGAIRRPLRSIVINIPHTYPAYPLNGILVSGFVAVDPVKAVYPAEVSNYLNSIGYVIDVDLEKARDDKERFLDDIFRSFDVRSAAVRHFMDNESWDVFVAAITETDRLHHFFYDAHDEETNSYHRRFVDFYGKVDLFLKDMFDTFMRLTGGKGYFMVLSDHGFAPLKKQVYLNAALRKAGLLALSDAGEYYERVTEKTKAFCMDPGRIYLHTKGRYPRGGVQPEEKDGLANEVKAILTELADEDGSPVMKRIFTNEEIYRGPAAGAGPDLVCLAHDGFALRGAIDKKEEFGDDIFTGVHTYDDAMCVLSDSIKREGTLSIDRLALFILDYFAAA